MPAKDREEEPGAEATDGLHDQFFYIRFPGGYTHYDGRSIQRREPILPARIPGPELGMRIIEFLRIGQELPQMNGIGVGGQDVDPRAETRPLNLECEILDS